MRTCVKEAVCEASDGQHYSVSAQSMTVKPKPPWPNEDYTNELPLVSRCLVVTRSGESASCLTAPAVLLETSQDDLTVRGAGDLLIHNMLLILLFFTCFDLVL